MVDRLRGRGRPIQVTVPEESTIIIIQKNPRGRAAEHPDTESEIIIESRIFRAALQDYMQFGADDIDKGNSFGKLLEQLRHARHIFSFDEFTNDLDRNLEEAKSLKEGATQRSTPGVFIDFKGFLLEEATEIWSEPETEQGRTLLYRS